MPETLTDKIRALFNSIDCKALVILRTPRAGGEVDNGCGVEFNLPEYAVIYEGNIMERIKTFEIHKFERKECIDIFKFDKKSYPDIDKFICELKEKDGYEVVYRS